MDAVPVGFHRSSATGLLLPDDIAREREVWTRDEARLLERATRLLEARGLALYLRCAYPDCVQTPIERFRHGDGGLVLRCAHKDRILSRSR